MDEYWFDPRLMFDETFLQNNDNKKCQVIQKLGLQLYENENQELNYLEGKEQH